MLATTSKAARRKSGAGRTGWSAASPRVEVVLIEVVEPATASVEVGTAKATTAMRWTTRARPSRSTGATAVEVVRRPAKFETRIVHRWSEVRWMRAVMGRHVWRHSSGRGEGWRNVNPGHDPELGHGFGAEFAVGLEANGSAIDPESQLVVDVGKGEIVAASAQDRADTRGNQGFVRRRGLGFVIQSQQSDLTGGRVELTLYGANTFFEFDDKECLWSNFGEFQSELKRQIVCPEEFLIISPAIIAVEAAEIGDQLG